METSENAKKAVEWYSKNRFIYDDLCKKVKSITKEILELNKINYYDISSRTKSVPSYEAKAQKGKYRNPQSEIKDMAGIRVITYTNLDAIKVFDIINQTFKVIPEFSGDKSNELGIDRVGYRSFHCIATMGAERLKLPENCLFEDVVFEIQIRTILAHAWAEFEHDRNYKFKGVLPNGLKRRLNTLAGTLELVDREFDAISTEIDVYIKDVEVKTEKGELSIPIDTPSLTAYLSDKFEEWITEKILNPEIFRDKEVIADLTSMGIDNLKKLDEAIPKDFVQIAKPFVAERAQGSFQMNFSSLITFILIIYDADKYFKRVWKAHPWSHLNYSFRPIAQKFGVNIDKYISKYHLRLY